jgi:DNA-binding NarL/FixJ family response regulator
MGRTQVIRIVIAEPLPLLRDGLAQILGAEADLRVEGTAGDGPGALSLVERHEPDVLVLDPAVSDQRGIEILRRLNTEATPTRVLLFTDAIGESDLLESLKLGAHGLVLKDAPTDSLLKAVRVVMTGQYWFNRTTLTGLVESLRRRLPAAVAAETRRGGRSGEPQLTPRESQVVSLIGRGASNRQVAGKLGVSVDTVKHHLTNIYDKVGVSSRLELAVYALDRGLADRRSAPRR